MNEENLRELADTVARSKSNTHRIDKLEEQTALMYEMNTNIALIAKQTDTTEKAITALKSDVEEIKSKPNRFIDKAKESAMSVLIGAVLGAIVALIL